MGNVPAREYELPEGWVDIRKAARVLGVDQDSLRQGIRHGEITAYREFELPDGTVVYGFRKEDLGL